MFEPRSNTSRRKVFQREYVEAFAAADRVVIGGGAGEAGDLLLNPTRAAFTDAVEAPDHRPSIELVPATLGNDAGSIGAAMLVLDGEDAVWRGAAG